MGIRIILIYPNIYVMNMLYYSSDHGINSGGSKNNIKAINN